MNPEIVEVVTNPEYIGTAIVIVTSIGGIIASPSVFGKVAGAKKLYSGIKSLKKILKRKKNG